MRHTNHHTMVTPQGCLAMKMLGWEDPFASAINAIRGREVHHASRMAQIRGLNLALQCVVCACVCVCVCLCVCVCACVCVCVLSQRR
jgi:hypothetical protein